jgi:two-component system OmpR family sensor kinase
VSRLRRARSLRARIVLTTATVTAVGMVVLVGLVAVVLAQLVDDHVARSLEDRVAAVSATLEPAGTSVRMRETPNEGFDNGIWVFDGTGRLVEGGTAPSTVRGAVMRLAAVTAPTVHETDGWALRAAPVTFNEATAPSAVVVVALALAPYQSTQAGALALCTGVGLLVVAGVTAVANWNVRRALAPVAQMAQRAAEWSETDLRRRFSLGTPHDEITRLGSVLDALLERVMLAFTAEQRLSSELAHELRTPLSVVRAEAELGAADPGAAPETAARLERIVRTADQMAEVIETLLSLARGTGHTAPESASVTAIVARVLGESGEDAGVAPTSDAAVAAPESFAARALAPLVQNALEHRAARAWIDVEGGADWVDILIRDDGAGLVELDPDEVFRPGTRGAGSAGAGLGLALARRMARAAGGDVEYRGAAPTTFALRLPRARPVRSRS